MTPLRVALVTGRFWPLAADEERLLADLAVALADGGAAVTVVAAQGHKSWPAHLDFRGLPVVRLPRSAARVWGAFRYQRSLAQWLLEHRREVDVLYVAGMRDEAYALLGAAGAGGPPLVLRAQGLGVRGDCQWHKSVHFGSRIAGRCRTADALVAPSNVAADELRQAGFPPQRIEVIADGVPPKPRKTAASFARSRAELAEAHPILVVPPEAPLVFYSGPIRDNPGLFDLIAAWPHVLQRFPQARLWLVGDATGADILWDEIQQASLTDTVILPGSFDLLDEVLPAASVVVHAAREPTPSAMLLEAMAAGVPIVATRTALTESLFDDGAALLTPPDDVGALAAALCRLLENAEQGRGMAESAWQKWRSRHTIARMAKDHLALFRRLLPTRTLALS